MGRLGRGSWWPSHTKVHDQAGHSDWHQPWVIHGRWLGLHEQAMDRLSTHRECDQDKEQCVHQRTERVVPRVAERVLGRRRPPGGALTEQSDGERPAVKEHVCCVGGERERAPAGEGAQKGGGREGEQRLSWGAERRA